MGCLQIACVTKHLPQRLAATIVTYVAIAMKLFYEDGLVYCVQTLALSKSVFGD